MWLTAKHIPTGFENIHFRAHFIDVNVKILVILHESATSLSHACDNLHAYIVHHQG